MSEHDNTNDPVEPAEPPAPPPVPVDEPPAPAARSRWRERTFRWRSVAAVAVAGVILGTAGGAVTTALVADDGPHEHDFDRHRMDQQMGPGMPAVPPGGRQGFPGDGADQDPDDDPDDGTDEDSGLRQG